MEIVHVYTRERKEFGRQPKFSNSPTELCVDLAPSEVEKDYMLKRNPCDAGVFTGPDLSEHECNTETFETESRGMNHTEGGWPKDINPQEAEQVIRYRKKVEKDEGYIATVQHLGDIMEHCIKQNNAIDIYQRYFEDTPLPLSEELPSAKSVNIFRDPSPTKRAVSAVSWYPNEGHKIAVAYSVVEFQRWPKDMPFESYIWNVENPNKPELSLKPISPLVTLEYNPKDPHTLIGGCYNGQLLLFDTRKGSQFVEATPIEKSHRDPIFSSIFLQSKTGTDCFTTSPDGYVHWWDIRKLGEPTESMSIDPNKNGNLVGGTVLEYESTMPTKFMIGTEFGQIYSCNRKSKDPSDKIAVTFPGHHGPVSALTRNPFYPKYFLSVGDWTARVWCEDIKESSIMWTPYYQCPLSDCAWSPTRPGVFLASRVDGYIEVWDLLFKQDDPTLSFKVSESGIYSLSIQDNGKLVACGNLDGSLTIVELSERLYNIEKNEKNLITSILEREMRREKILEARNRELKLKEKVEKATALRAGKTAAAGEEREEEEEDLVKKAEDDFWSMIANERADLEKRKAKANKLRLEDRKETVEEKSK